MKLPCGLVQDVLPLYHDGVCSDESKVLVAEHLKECAKCSAMLTALDSEIDVSALETNAAKPLTAISKEWKKSKLRAWCKGIVVTVIVFAILLGGFAALTQWKCLAVTTNGATVAEIYQLKDGRIVYKLDAPNSDWCWTFNFEETVDGRCYKTPVRSIVEMNENNGLTSALAEYMIIDPNENNAVAQVLGKPHITKWYIGKPDDAILIYEEGMELEPAPQWLEDLKG